MRILISCVLLLSLLPTGLGQSAEQASNGAAQQPANADELMAEVFARDTQREMIGQGYVGTRRYVFDNQRLHKHAEVTVSIRCDPDGTKHFEVVNEEGWKTANHRILRKMIESEAETSRPDVRPKTRLIPDNYNFALVQAELLDGRLAYAIEVTPKREDKYLFEGRIWVDARDYAVVRVEGKPAKNPSFWTRSIHFVHQYQKSGDFWYPATTESITQARIVGKTDVVIRYFDYTPNAKRQPEPSNNRKGSVQEAKYAFR